MSPAKHGSARRQLAIQEVRDGILILPGYRYRMVLATSSVNIELQSEAEQDALMDSFQQFLNALTKPIQILVRTRALDVDRYLTDLAEAHAEEAEPIYRDQLSSYREFVRSLVAGNKILTRRFYLVAPFDADRKTEFEVVKEQLTFETEIIAKGLGKLGMTTRSLTSLEVLDLFYNFYQPELAKSQPLTHTLSKDPDAFVTR